MPIYRVPLFIDGPMTSQYNLQPCHGLSLIEAAQQDGQTDDIIMMMIHIQIIIGKWLTIYIFIKNLMKKAWYFSLYSVIYKGLGSSK